MSERISVLGLGKMGSALARTLLKHENEVTVWNRTASKAEPLVAAGASKAPDPVNAIADSEIIIICVGNYEDSERILSNSGDHGSRRASPD